MSGDINDFFFDGKHTYFATGQKHGDSYQLCTQHEDYLQLVYTLRFTDNPLSPKIVNADVQSFVKNNRELNYAVLNRKQISNDFLVITYLNNSRYYVYLLNRHTSHSICFDATFKSGEMLMEPKLIDDTYYYSVVNPTYVTALFPNSSFVGGLQQKIYDLVDYYNFVIVKYRIKKE